MIYKAHQNSTLTSKEYKKTHSTRIHLNKVIALVSETGKKVYLKLVLIPVSQVILIPKFTWPENNSFPPLQNQGTKVILVMFPEHYTLKI